MDPEVPNWKLIDEASRHLTGLGRTPFSRLDVYRLIWQKHPERQRPSLDPTFQGMVSNASGGPSSACGTPLRRVERGLYERQSTPAAERQPVRTVTAGTGDQARTSADLPALEEPPPQPASTTFPPETLRTATPRKTPSALEWSCVWSQAGRQLAQHAAAGRGHLLTEDTLRFAVALAIEAQGLPPSAITVEWPEPLLGQGKLDMAVKLGASERAVIELKFPRDARGPISPDTNTLGELLRDFHRVSRLDAQERWVVQLLNARLLRYLERVTERHPLRWARDVGEVFLVGGDVVSGLPKSARDTLAGWNDGDQVSAHCQYAEQVTPDLRLLAYSVDALGRC